jgi:PAS domain S-box-containing protein
MAFLMVYITMGVLKAQRLLLGIMCSFLLYIYFAMLLKIQCSKIPDDALRDVVHLLLEHGTASVNLSAVSNLISFFTIPLIYSSVPAKIGRTWRIMLALTGSLALGMIPETALCWINNSIHDLPWQGMVMTLISAPGGGLLLSLYLTMLEKELPDDSGKLDFLFAFFGSYGRVKELENDLSNWEDRYQSILRNTAEMVIMCDAGGVIQEVNIAAQRIFGVKSNAAMIGKELFGMLEEVDPPRDLHTAADGVISFNCTVNSGGEHKIISATLSPIHLREQLLLVMVGRDITGEVMLAKEKEELTEQLMHSQRMESLGMLAGGIAHDFNNCIHAIMGHADVAAMLYTNDPEKISSHLQKISTIAEKAGKLTSQLLGFARKGKYNVVDIDLAELLEECTGLLDPFRMRGVEIKSNYPSHPAVIRGDQLQMQQVVLNLLINAADATSANEGAKIITLSAGKAVNAPLPFTPPADRPDEAESEYLFFAVQDNGSGMDEVTRKKIFEPFFTTKPVGSGTGMGLAMVYGTVTHHRGWIQLESTPGKGTLFCFFFPAAKK